MLALALALALPAAALDVNDVLALTTADGDTVRGWYAGATPSAVLVTAAGETHAVLLDTVVAATRDGHPLALDRLASEHAAAWATEAAWLADPPPLPRPGATAAASLAWAGAGHAMLGDGAAAAGWAGLDLVLVGTATWALVGQEAWGPAISVLAVDALVRGAAAGSASRRARRRRARMQEGRKLLEDGVQ